MSTKNRIMAALLIGLCFIGGTCLADETALFSTSVPPDALIVLDLSGSMNFNPAGDSDNTWGTSTSCNGSFYSYSGGSHTTDCSRLAIAKRAIFSILDDNGDNQITAADETSLNVRVGYMRFYSNDPYGGNDTGGDYNSGYIRLSKPIGATYRSIFCNTTHSSGCTISSTCSLWCSDSTACVNSECASGGTPLASALNEAKLYLNANKAADSAAACRQKFVILITDGSDTYACGGDGTETQSDMYKRRREFVAKAKALADAGYKVFVIGFGSAMPNYLENTLNWMAYYGGTDNALDTNSGSPSGYNPTAVTSCGISTTTGTRTSWRDRGGRSRVRACATTSGTPARRSRR